MWKIIQKNGIGREGNFYFCCFFIALFCLVFLSFFLFCLFFSFFLFVLLLYFFNIFVYFRFVLFLFRFSTWLCWVFMRIHFWAQYAWHFAFILFCCNLSLLEWNIVWYFKKKNYSVTNQSLGFFHCPVSSPQ